MLPTTYCFFNASRALFLSTWSNAYFKSIRASNIGMSHYLAFRPLARCILFLAVVAVWCASRLESSKLQSPPRAQPQVTLQLPQCRQTCNRSEPAQVTCSCFLGFASFSLVSLSLRLRCFLRFFFFYFLKAFETVSRETTTGSVGSRALSQSSCQAVTLRGDSSMMYAWKLIAPRNLRLQVFPGNRLASSTCIFLLMEGAFPSSMSCTRWLCSYCLFRKRLQIHTFFPISITAFFYLMSSPYASQVFPRLQQVSSKSFGTSSFTGFELLASFPCALLAFLSEVSFQPFQSSSSSVCQLR